MSVAPAGTSGKAGRVFHGLAKGHQPRWLVAPLLLASNWVFQGLLIMDPAERRFKLGLDVALGATALLLFRWGTALGWWAAVALALAAAHTVNWIANGQVPVVLKNLGMTRLDEARRGAELSRLAARAEGRLGRHSLEAVHAYGSLARGEAHPGSDLDVRLLRRSGLAAAIASCLLAMGERTRATVMLLPLDIYVIDRVENLQKAISAKELARPVVVWSRDADGGERRGEA